MEITVRKEGDRIRFEIDGDIDESGAEELKSRFHELGAPSFKEVVFDLGNVNYIGSAGIGKLLLLYKRVAAKGGEIRIENATKTVYDLFIVLKLDTIFTISRAR